MDKLENLRNNYDIINPKLIKSDIVLDSNIFDNYNFGHISITRTNNYIEPPSFNRIIKDIDEVETERAQEHGIKVDLNVDKIINDMKSSLIKIPMFNSTGEIVKYPDGRTQFTETNLFNLLFSINEKSYPQNIQINKEAILFILNKQIITALDKQNIILLLTNLCNISLQNKLLDNTLLELINNINNKIPSIKKDSLKELATTGIIKYDTPTSVSFINGFVKKDGGTQSDNLLVYLYLLCAENSDFKSSLLHYINQYEELSNNRLIIIDFDKSTISLYKEQIILNMLPSKYPNLVDEKGADLDALTIVKDTYKDGNKMSDLYEVMLFLSQNIVKDQFILFMFSKLLLKEKEFILKGKHLIINNISLDMTMLLFDVLPIKGAIDITKAYLKRLKTRSKNPKFYSKFKLLLRIADEFDLIYNKGALSTAYRDVYKGILDGTQMIKLTAPNKNINLYAIK